MFSKRIIVLGICFVLVTQAMITSGCKADSNRITTPADFTGYVTHIKLHQNRSGIHTISAESHADKLVHRCLIKVTNNTMFFKLEGETYHPSGPDKLKLKDQIQVWFFKPAKNSIPDYGKAKQIVISTFTNFEE